MRIRALAFTCTVCLAAVAVSSAAEPSKKGDSPPAEPSSQTSNGLEMAEDLEIMGAVLRAALTKLYAPQAVQEYTVRGDSPPGYRPFGMSPPESWDPYNRAIDYRRIQVASSYLPGAVEDPAQQIAQPATAGPPRAEVVRRPEAAYLGDYGVVYQITLDVPPPSQRQPKGTAEDADGPSRGPGAWEIATRNLRGGPYAEPPRREKYRAPSKDDLVGKLLDVLAENAPRFRHLKSQDRLSVAITFPRSKPPSKPADRGYLSATSSDLKGVPTITNTVEERSSYEVSGDLHMRQKNYRRAVEAFENALKVAPDQPRKPAIARKLIGAYVAAGDLKNAEKWIAFLKKQRPTGSDSQNDACQSAGWRLIPLPARLTVSVVKSRLDELAAGKMKREELNQHATVDYFNPPADRPGLGSPKALPSSGYPRRSMSYDSGGMYHGYDGCSHPPSGRGSKPRVDR